MAKHTFQVTHSGLPEALEPSFLLPKINDHLTEHLDVMDITWGFCPLVTIDTQFGVLMCVRFPTKKCMRSNILLGKKLKDYHHPYALARWMHNPYYHGKHHSQWPKKEVPKPWLLFEPSPDEYARLILAGLKKIDQPMSAPVHVSGSLRLIIKIHMKTCPHKGGSLLLNIDNMKRRSPKNVATDIARGINNIYHQCDKCGLKDAVSLYSRIWHHTAVAKTASPTGVEKENRLRQGYIYDRKAGKYVLNLSAAAKQLCGLWLPPSAVDYSVDHRKATELHLLLQKRGLDTTWSKDFLERPFKLPLPLLPSKSPHQGTKIYILPQAPPPVYTPPPPLPLPPPKPAVTGPTVIRRKTRVIFLED